MGISSTHERTKNIDGRPGYSWDYDITMIGTKSYMIDIMAAICLEQLKKLEGNLAIRRGIQNYYNNVLPSEVQRPVWSNTVQHYGARVEASLRDELIDYLASKKIHTSVHYKPLHLHTLFKGQNALPVAEKEWQRLISLPCHPAMSGDDMGYVAYWLRRFMNEHSL